MSVSSTQVLNIFFAAQILTRNTFALFCVEAMTEEVFRFKTETSRKANRQSKLDIVLDGGCALSIHVAMLPFD